MLNTHRYNVYGLTILKWIICRYKLIVHTRGGEARRSSKKFFLFLLQSLRVVNIEFIHSIITYLF